MKAAIVQYDSVKCIFNFRLALCTTAGSALVWTGCKRKAGRNATAADEFLKARHRKQ